MDSMLEKITLYDIMSYFVPGFLCLVLIVFALIPELSTSNLDVYNNYKGYIGFTFVIFSYVAGIAISSVARFFCSLINEFLKKRKEDKSNRDKSNRDKSNRDKSNETYNQSLRNALLQSGMSEKDAESCISKDDSLLLRQRQDFLDMWIYADIQADPRYKRIHNYASSEFMYKNIAVAFILAAIVPETLHFFLKLELQENMNILIVFEILLAVIFFFRWKRFEGKKKRYAVNWFIEKYCAQKSDTDLKKNE